MRIAYVTAEGPGRADLLLAETVARLESRGVRLAGAVATDLATLGRKDCAARLRMLPDGPVVQISEPAPDGDSCGLDPAALTAAALLAERQLAGAQGFVLNKFGRLEAQGRGFAPVIAAALERDLPVLIGVGDGYHADFLAFTDGLARHLPADAAEAAGWLSQQLRRAA